MTYQEKKTLAITYISNTLDQNKKYSCFYQIYPFSTENLSGYFDEDLLKNKKVLLTGSSADQIITAQLFNAKKITCYDLNPFVEFMYDLKIAAIKELFRDEFINYFYYYNQNETSFDYKIYKRIRKSLTGESLDFWDTLYGSFSALEIRKKLFASKDEENNPELYKELIPYLSEENYYKLNEKSNFVKVGFIESNVLDVTEKLNDSYDTIYFSNIFSRLEMLNFYNKQYIRNLYNFMNRILSHTNLNGNIILDYFYGARKKEFFSVDQKWTHHIRFPIKCFHCEQNISYKEVSSVAYDESAKVDTVLIYTKKLIYKQDKL